MDITRVSAAILAGGKSSRMGRDKAALPFGGETLLTYQARKLRALGVGELLLSGASEAVPGAHVVPDLLPGRGPLGGLHACLSAASGEAVLVLSVDVPLVPASALAALIAAHAGGVTLLEHGGVTEPLIGVYDASLAPEAGRLLLEGVGAVRLLAERADFRTVAYDGDPALLLNCNTPADYQKALEQLHIES